MSEIYVAMKFLLIDINMVALFSWILLVGVSGVCNTLSYYTHFMEADPDGTVEGGLTLAFWKSN